MKKLLFVVLAAIGMASCMNTDEVVEVNSDNAIAFADAFIENSVRAIIENGNDLNQFNQFKVWGWMKEGAVEAPVFNGRDVENNGAGWTYSPAQYWVPGFTYTFQVLSSNGGAGWIAAETTEGNGHLGVVNFTNNDGTEDLIYATATVEAPALGATKTVELSFNHQLAKIGFAITTGQEFTTAGVTLAVHDIEMVVPASATIRYSDDFPTWALGNGTTTLKFGAGDVELLTIPAEDYEYAITFKVDYIQNGQTLKTFDKTSSVTLDVAMGNSYRFTAELTPENMGMSTVEFDTTVNPWNPGGEPGFAPDGGQGGGGVGGNECVELNKLIDAYDNFVSIIVKMGEDGVSTELDYNTWESVLTGEGHCLSLEVFSRNGKLNTGTYTASATGDTINAGEFRIGYDFLSLWGEMLENQGTCWWTVANNVVSAEKVLDGTVEVLVEGDNLVIKLQSTTANTKFTCPVADFPLPVVDGEAPVPVINFTFDESNITSQYAENIYQYDGTPAHFISISDGVSTSIDFGMCDFEYAQYTPEYSFPTNHFYPVVNGNGFGELPTSSGIMFYSSFVINGEEYVPINDSPTDENGLPYGVELQTEMPAVDMNILTFYLLCQNSSRDLVILSGTYSGPLGYQ